MGVEISYAHLTREHADEKAIADCMDYLTGKQWEALLAAIEGGVSVAQLNIYFGFTGISGYPFHAMMRKYRLEDYRAWMADDKDGLAFPTDEQGFLIINDKMVAA